MPASTTGMSPNTQNDSNSQTYKGPNYWFRQIGRQEFPVFRQTVLSVARVLSQIKSSSTEMAQAVARDPFLAVRVVRMANSAFYSAGIQRVSSVHRAVIVVGFDALRHLCASVDFVEDSFRGIRLKSIQRHVLLSYHQALLAQWFAESIRDGAPEEVYSAGLLADIGLIHLLGMIPVSSVLALSTNLERHGLESQEDVERQVLGFASRFVTAKMASDWKLGDLLEKVARDHDVGDPRVKCVRYARALTRALAQDPEGRSVLAAREAIGDELKMSQMSLRRMIDAAARWARRWGCDYGLDEEELALFSSEGAAAAEPEAEPEIPLLEILSEEQGSSHAVPAAREPDDSRQLEIIDAIHALLMDRNRRNSQELWDLVADGMRNGAGFDRVAVMRLASGGRFLEVRGLYGDFDPGLEGLMVPVTSYRNLFTYCLDCPEPLWVRDESPDEIRNLLGPEVLQFFGSRDFILARVMGRGGPVGLIGADRRETDRTLDEEALRGFRRFWRCASVAVEVLEI
ncbi:HD-like signal output (HDOD) domain, no enzymatic activity [Desulfacinum infernum DSM 9756]|uniref:HD-like signal output (HDOD) domain, no enzymatic activity n=2 Tax=Desulfacinum infernum TaxID=35837 RepID=A0A1M5BTA7_9BACT|nr:HD-like signal output (HDOD) domain, no enzymatic activity [Desulfacinum infernum DSM 9756]